MHFYHQYKTDIPTTLSYSAPHNCYNFSPYFCLILHYSNQHALYRSKICSRVKLFCRIRRGWERGYSDLLLTCSDQLGAASAHLCHMISFSTSDVSPPDMWFYTDMWFYADMWFYNSYIVLVPAISSQFHFSEYNYTRFDHAQVLL